MRAAMRPGEDGTTVTLFGRTGIPFLHRLPDRTPRFRDHLRALETFLAT